MLNKLQALAITDKNTILEIPQKLSLLYTDTISEKLDTKFNSFFKRTELVTEKEAVTEWFGLSSQKAKNRVKKAKAGQMILGFARNTEQERAFAED